MPSVGSEADSDDAVMSIVFILVNLKQVMLARDT